MAAHQPDPGLGSRYWNLWTAFSAVNLGDGLSLVAFPLLAITITDDARLVALVSVFRFLPFVVIGLPAGVLLDRFDRRLLGILAQLGRATGMAVGAAVVVAEAATIPVLLAIGFAIGVGEVLTDGGLPALVRDVVRSDQLEVANSRLSATQTVTNLFVGPPIGALLFELRPSLPFVAAGVLYLGAAGLLTRLTGTEPPVRSPEDDGAGFRAEVTAGLRYVWSHPVLRPLALTVAIFSFVGEAGNGIFVILATERFGLSSTQYGLLIGVDGVASVAMSFLVARLVTRTSHATSMRLSIVTYTIAALLFGVGTTIGAVVLASVFMGISDPTWNVVSATIRQRLVPGEVFGRMMTAYLFIAWGMQPVGALMGGVVAERWGPQWVFVISGSVVASLLVLGRPLFRQIPLALAAAEPPTPPDPKH
ncbi:MAG: MFS transporter [Actinomycetota bacterium]